MSTSERQAQPYHHGDLRRALIDASLTILAEGGDAAGLSLREVARRVGVSAMAPYRHFADKDALLDAVSVVGFERLRAALIEADRIGTPREGLIGQGNAYVAFACANPALFRLMFGGLLAKKSPERVAVGAAAHAVTVERMATLVSPDRAADWALHCWAIAHGLAALAIDGQLTNVGEPAEPLAGRILNLLAIPDDMSSR